MEGSGRRQESTALFWAAAEGRGTCLYCPLPCPLPTPRSLWTGAPPPPPVTPATRPSTSWGTCPLRCAAGLYGRERGGWVGWVQLAACALAVLRGHLRDQLSHYRLRRCPATQRGWWWWCCCCGCDPTLTIPSSAAPILCLPTHSTHPIPLSLHGYCPNRLKHDNQRKALFYTAPLPPTPPHTTPYHHFAMQDYSPDRLKYENQRKALFYTDAGSRRLYKDHVRAVSKAGGWGRGRVGVGVGWRRERRRPYKDHDSRCLLTCPQRRHRVLEVTCYDHLLLCSTCLAPVPTLSPIACLLWQILERRNTITGRLYRSDPTIMAFDLLNEPRCSAYEVGMAVELGGFVHHFALRMRWA